MFVSKKIQYQDSVLLIFTCRFNAFLIKTPAGPFVDVIKLDLRFIQRDERPRIANTILKEKNAVVRLTLPDFRIYHKPAVIKTMSYWQMNIQTSHF